MDRLEIYNLLIESGFETVQLTNPDNQPDINSTTYPVHPNILLTVRPKPNDSDRYTEITKLLSLAKEHGFAVHPCSRGRNLGYGGMQPYSPSVIIDLRNFNGISGYVSHQHQITVEPGVTQQQLSDYLRDNGNIHWMDCTGAPTDASIVGNYLERGFGHSRRAEHAKSIITCLFVTPNDKNIEPSIHYSAVNGAYNQNKQNYHVTNLGPDLSGALIQCNWAIILNMTIELERAPDAFVPFFIPFTADKAHNVIDECAKLKSNHTIHSGAHIGNAMKTLQLIASKFPSIIPDYKADTLAELVKRLGLDDWTLSGAFYGTENQIKANIADLKVAMKPLGIRPMFLTPSKMQVIQRAAAIARGQYQRIEKGLQISTLHLSKISGKLALLDSLLALCDLKKGIPSNFFLSTVYWRNLHKLNHDEGLDLERDRVGLFWAAPCISIQGESFNEVSLLMNEYCKKYRLECPISATLLNQRQMEVVLSLSFDLESQEQTESAINCYKDLLETCAEKGFIKYRLSTYSNSFTQNESLGLNAPLLQLNKVFDPSNVISPLKYTVVNLD